MWIFGCGSGSVYWDVVTVDIQINTCPVSCFSFVSEAKAEM